MGGLPCKPGGLQGNPSTVLLTMTPTGYEATASFLHVPLCFPSGEIHVCSEMSRRSTFFKLVS